MNSEDHTRLAAKPDGQEEKSHICPMCGQTNPIDSLRQSEYRCSQCKLELAHLDYAANGAVRGVFGWLLLVDTVVKDRYRIRSALGKGGFGATYLVDDLSLGGKRRALKEVPELLFDEYETSLLSRLDHPAIPDIIDRSTNNGMVYLVLKFGGNRTLASERKRYPDQRIPPSKLYPWMRQLCEVLIYLHKQRPPIIHRDLKPENILLNEDERIMLIDFGIAKEATPDAVTRTIGRAATLGFSPPEQVMGTGTDARADIYALGATFYALLTGHNPPASHERISGTEPIPPSQVLADVPPAVEDAILTALNLNKHQRQLTVREFAAALEGVEAGPDGATPISGEPLDHTVAMSHRITGAVSERLSKPNSLRLPTASRPLTAVPIPPPAPSRRTSLIMAGVAGIAIAAAAVYFFKTGQSTGASSVTPSPASPPAIDSASSAQPIQSPPNPPLPAQPAPATLAPSQPAPAAIRPQALSKSGPAEASVAAEELLKAHSDDPKPQQMVESQSHPRKQAKAVTRKTGTARPSVDRSWDKAHREIEQFLNR